MNGYQFYPSGAYLLIVPDFVQESQVAMELNEVQRNENQTTFELSTVVWLIIIVAIVIILK